MNTDIIFAALGFTIGILLASVMMIKDTSTTPILDIATRTEQYDQEKAKCEQGLPRNQQCTFKWEFVK